MSSGPPHTGKANIDLFGEPVLYGFRNVFSVTYERRFRMYFLIPNLDKAIVFLCHIGGKTHCYFAFQR